MILAGVSLAVFACNLPSSVPIPPTQTSVPTAFLTDTPAPGPVYTYQPVFEPAPCAFAVPSGTHPDCGYLVVPEDRARPDSPVIRLHVAIFRNLAGTPVPDPVVHLAGGPGSSSLEVAGYILGRGLDAVLAQRDLIFFDQRGTGASVPRLDCPERQAITSTLLDGSLSRENAQAAVVDAFQRCRERLLSQGIDLSAYQSAASAADLNDLRLALGVEQLNLYAVSYGTRLALTLMRDYPQAVRSAVLDSVYPLEVNLYTALAPNADRAFHVFFDRCASSPDCSAAYPDLRRVFYELVDQLNASPVPVSLFAGGAERPVRLDGDLLIDVLFVGLYNPAVTASMPQMIYDIRQGDFSILEGRLALYFETSSALGMQMAVQCAEEFPFNSPEEAFAAAQGIQPQIAAYYPASVQPLFTVCREWATVLPSANENLPVASDLPVLVLAGEYDPITPPEWGRSAAQHLPHSYFYEFPGHGHWVTRSSRCAVAMALAFWNEPAVDPGLANPSCL
jgi:pimeloyl-ACP methyl ester carboxylesterase